MTLLTVNDDDDDLCGKHVRFSSDLIHAMTLARGFGFGDGCALVVGGGGGGGGGGGEKGAKGLVVNLVVPQATGATTVM